MRNKIVSLMFAVLVLPAVLFAAGEKSEGPAKITLMNFAKGDMLVQTYDKNTEISLTEEHITGKEKIRCKAKGPSFAMNLSRNLDWSKHNYLVFNIFVEGDQPWKGGLIFGDKSSAEKWSGNNCGVDLVLKPGENKDVHVNIQGLYSTSANRPMDMSNMRTMVVYNPKQGPNTALYFGNIYLVYEEE